MYRIVNSSQSITGMAKETSTGVFWLIDDKIFAFPFYEGYVGNGIAKSGTTFNHKRLWEEIKPRKYSKFTYNYFPRGRVDFSNKGKPIIYMNPNIDESFIPDIKSEFGLRQDVKIRYDYSDHYKCHLDDGWKPDK